MVHFRIRHVLFVDRKVLTQEFNGERMNSGGFDSINSFRVRANVMGGGDYSGSRGT